MKNKIIISITFILPLAIYFLLLAFSPNNTLDASAEAKSGIPKVLVFSTPMCSECRKMAPLIEDAKTNYKNKIEITKIDASERTPSTNKLIRQHRVYLVPTLIYIDKNGKVIDRTEGSMPYGMLDNYLKRLIK